MIPRVRPATVTAAVLGLAILLRLLGVALNNEANDPHLGVVRIIAYEGRFPADHEDWEAFQPKLYHLTVAAALRALPPLRAGLEIRVAQGVSCAAGVATLFVLLVFLRGLPFPAAARQAAFALGALNPKAIATSIQATNDAFVVFFATLALAAGVRFFRSPGRGSFAGMATGALLAGVSKGNGLVVGVAVLCAFAAAIARPSAARRRLLGFAVLFGAAFVAFVPPLGGYWARYREGRSPFATNRPPAPAPPVFRQTFEGRPGVTSVAHAFLTFRLASLLEDPMITNDPRSYPPHRTSFWSLLYGGAHSVHYDSWPPSWQSRSPAVAWLLRAIWICALVPTAALLWGAWRAAARVARGPFQDPGREGWGAELLLALTAAGQLAFLIAYGYRYRDFSTMKAIFLYPAAASLLACWACGLARLAGRSRALSRAAYGSAAALCAGYVAEVALLLADLARLRLG